MARLSSPPLRYEAVHEETTSGLRLCNLTQSSFYIPIALPIALPIPYPLFSPSSSTVLALDFRLLPLLLSILHLIAVYVLSPFGSLPPPSLTATALSLHYRAAGSPLLSSLCLHSSYS